MTAEWTPMRWPGSWKSPSAIGLLKGTPINWLLVDPDAGHGPVIEEAKRAGLEVAETALPPAGVDLIAGEWPGVAVSRGGDGASAVPTGVPWVDSNSWRIRLEAARRPGADIWVDAPPKGVVRSSSYRTAIADAAAHSGRWVISLDTQLAAQLAAQLVDGQADALRTWREIAGAAAFFAKRRPWAGYPPSPESRNARPRERRPATRIPRPRDPRLPVPGSLLILKRGRETVRVTVLDSGFE